MSSMQTHAHTADVDWQLYCQMHSCTRQKLKFYVWSNSSEISVVERLDYCSCWYWYTAVISIFRQNNLSKSTPPHQKICGFSVSPHFDPESLFTLKLTGQTFIKRRFSSQHSFWLDSNKQADGVTEQEVLKSLTTKWIVVEVQYSLTFSEGSR